MAVYDSTVMSVGANIYKGLDRIAKAIEKASARPTINVIVMPGATIEEVETRVTEVLDRVAKREASVS